MIKAGIIDPTKVVRHALQDAASIAGLSSPPRRWSPRSRSRNGHAGDAAGGGGMGGMDF